MNDIWQRSKDNMLEVDPSSWHMKMLLGKYRPYARHVCGSGGKAPLNIN